MQAFKTFLKRLIGGAVAPLLHYGGLLSILRWFRRRLPNGRGHVLILTYHRICDPSGPDFTFVSETLGVDPGHFEGHMRHLKRHFEVISLDEAVRAMRENLLGQRDLVVVTFDDGYYDNYAAAWPVLQALDLPATIFLATDFIEDKDIMWNDRLAPLLDQLAPETARDVLRKKIPDDIYSAIHDYLSVGCDLKLAKIDALCQLFKPIADREKHAIIDRIAAAVPDPEIRFKQPLMMNWVQILEMYGENIGFGAHSCSHPILSRVAEEQLERELGESKKIIEEQIGATVEHFAYPNGGPEDYPADIGTRLSRQGYVSACTQSVGINTAETDSFFLKRLPIGDYSLPLFDLVIEFRFLAHRWFSSSN